MRGILGFLAFDRKSREFKRFRKSLIESAKAKMQKADINIDKEFKEVIKGIRNGTIRPSRDYRDFSPQLVNLAETILNFSSEVGAFLSTRVFITLLFQSGLSLWGQGELMLVYESMFKIDAEKAEKAGELIAYALYMMDHRFIAHDTYIHMVDWKMQEMTKKKLQHIDEELSEIIIRG
jgi:hypothetical protein